MNDWEAYGLDSLLTQLRRSSSKIVASRCLSSSPSLSSGPCFFGSAAHLYSGICSRTVLIPSFNAGGIACLNGSGHRWFWQYCCFYRLSVFLPAGMLTSKFLWMGVQSGKRKPFSRPMRPLCRRCRPMAGRLFVSPELPVN